MLLKVAYDGVVMGLQEFRARGILGDARICVGMLGCSGDLRSYAAW